jgi:hypothetical protein
LLWPKSQIAYKSTPRQQHPSEGCGNAISKGRGNQRQGPIPSQDCGGHTKQRMVDMIV